MTPLRKALFLLLFGLVALFLQSTMKFHLTSYAFLVPNFVLILVVFLGFREVSLLGAFSAFLLGVLFDLSSGTLIGPWAGAFILIYGVLSALAQRIFVDAFVAAFFAIFVASIVGNVLYMFLTYEVSSAGTRPFLKEFLVEAFTTALLGPPVFGFLKAVLVRRGDRR